MQFDLEAEKAAAAELDEMGWIISFYPDRHNKWFVGIGSHGGSAYSLRKAIKRALWCCKVGINQPDWVEQATQVMDTYLGGWK